MPRMLSRVGIAVALLLAPSLTFAAANDVTLTTSAVLSVNGITLNVSGSGGSIESMIVNATNFSVTLLSGSTFEVTAPGREQLAVDNTDGATGSICNDSQSVISYTATHTMTVVVSPSATLCVSAPATPTSGGGGGGGGSSTASVTSTSSVVATTLAATTTPATASTTTPAVAATPTNPVTPASPSSSGLSVLQVKSILDLLASFDADASVIASVKASLQGTALVASPAVHVFASDLFAGSPLGNEVKALQQFLNSHGYPVTASGPGSSGKETSKFGPATKAALIKYQKAKGVTPASGYFGAKTRAVANADL